MCIVVVLPAPFEPSKPKTSFSFMSRVRLSTAVSRPYCLTRFLIFITADNNSQSRVLCLGVTKRKKGEKDYLPPIRNILVPQTGQTPWVAGLPFFMVTFFSSFIVLLALHLTDRKSVV